MYPHLFYYFPYCVTAGVTRNEFFSIFLAFSVDEKSFVADIELTELPKASCSKLKEVLVFCHRGPF